jgi:hypothetical protein
VHLPDLNFSRFSHIGLDKQQTLARGITVARAGPGVRHERSLEGVLTRIPSCGQAVRQISIAGSIVWMGLNVKETGKSPDFTFATHGIEP